MELIEIASPRDESLPTLARQCGVTSMASFLDGAEQDRRMFAAVGAGVREDVAPGLDAPWSKRALRRIIDHYARWDLAVSVIEDTPPLDRARLGLDGRDGEIDAVRQLIRSMGELGIPVLCYNWMALTSWARTTIDTPARGGALVTSFRESDAAALGDLVEPGAVTEEQLWDGLAYFLRATIPVAEEYGVRLALHPDDPPLQRVRGLPRIMSSVAAFRRLLEIDHSNSHAITLCQGNFVMMEEDLLSTIEEFTSADRVAFVHMRDVRGTAADFAEVFHDESDPPLARCIELYERFGFSGAIRADHVPTLYGEDNSRPAYGTLGRLYALGYLRGLIDSTAGPRARAGTAG